MEKLLRNKKFRFLVVGGTNTIIDFGLMNILSKIFGLPLIAANTISMTVALIFSFFANKKYTFKSSDKTRVKREMMLFLAFTLFGLYVIQNSVIWLFSQYIHIGFLNDFWFDNLAKVVGTIPSLIWNYVTYDRFVFKGKKDEDEPIPTV